MPSEKRKFGDFGEKIAINYLIGKGYQIIEQNYLKPWGEIDLIGRLRNNLIFFEVKTRDLKNVEHFLPEHSIDRRKIRNLQKICETYLNEKRYPVNQQWQIDVISIAIDKIREKAKIKHIENAIWEKPY